MFPRADMTGARPVSAIETIKTTVSIADARQDVLQRLTQIAVGRMMQAQVLSRMADGSFMVKLAEVDNAPIRMNLPAGTQVGDTLELTLAATHPRPTFSLATSARESAASLSPAARLIDSALRTAQKEGAPTALVGKTPLVQSPAAAPTQLATALKDTLAFSGLFYESHVQQWASGERPLTELMREPQAKNSNQSLIAATLLRSDKAVTPEPLEGNSSPGTGSAFLAAHMPDPPAGAEANLGVAPKNQTAVSPNASLPTDSPVKEENQTSQPRALPDNTAAETAIDNEASAKPLTDNRSPTNLPSETKAPPDNPPSDTTGQARTGALDSESARMISLQLDTLEHRRIAWQGELWPGQQMEWEVTEDAQSSAGSDIERSWQSVVRFELPNLGNISVAIRLTGQRLQVQVRTANEGTASLLRAHGNELASALDAAGSPLDLFTVKRDESA